MYWQYQRFKSSAKESIYKNYKNRLSHTLKIAERKHYADIFENNKHNLKKTWGILKSIINRNKSNQIQGKFKLSDGTVITDKCKISEQFNNFFVGVGPGLARKIPQQQITPDYYLGDAVFNSIYLAPVNEDEIKEIILSLKDSAAGYDEIKPHIFKLTVPFIKTPLAHICTLSLDQGIFPTELKLANVLPLYKADDPMLFNNYTPVSLLNVMSKVFERIMYSRLLSFLETYKILYQNQFGFRKQHSTYMALMLLIDEITKSLENNEYVVGVFLDFSKAFDTVNHDILLKKLDHYGIRGNALAWFKSYLHGREQFVTYNGTPSKTKIITCGVPQGSILGPLLFLIYINDLSKLCKELMSILFADDTNMFKNGKDLNHLQNVINCELQSVSTWLKVNKLSLNIKKTHFMVFSNKRGSHDPIDIRIDGERIHEVLKTKFLGVIIDKNLSWKDHITYISGKIARGLGMIIKTRKYLNKSALMSLYYSFIYPYITYCNHIWGTACISHLNKLIVLQKKAIRIISGAKFRAPSAPLFSSLGVIKIMDINMYLIARFMFRVYNEEVPIQFISMFTVNRAIHLHYTRQVNELHIPRVKTNLRKFSIKYRGAVIWNRVLKLNIPLNTSEPVFVKKLKQQVMNGSLYVP